MTSMSLDDSELLQRIIGLQNAFLTTSCDSSGCADELESIVGLLHQKQTQGMLTPVIKKLAAAVAHNVITLAQATLRIQSELEDPTDGLSVKIRKLLDSNDKGEGQPTLSCSRTTRKREASPSPPSSLTSLSDLDADSDSNSDTPISTSSKPLQPPDHIRLWFLANLANPYPTPTEKASLIRLTGLPRRKIDSDMTNWRRRAGWTDIKDHFAGGDKDAVAGVIEMVEDGQEKRKEVREAVERMKAYLERREEERVGDWVKELPSLAGSNKRKRAKIEPVVKREDTRPTNHVAGSSLFSVSSMSSLSAASNNARSHPPTTVSIRSTSSPYISSFSSSGASTFNYNAYSYTDQTQLNAGQKRMLESDPHFLAGRGNPYTRANYESTSLEAIDGQITQWSAYPNFSKQPYISDSAGYVSYVPTMWSSTPPLHILPHMQAEASNGWTTPTQSKLRSPMEWRTHYWLAVKSRFS